MAAIDDDRRHTSVALDLIDAYVRADRRMIGERSAAISPEAGERVVSALKVCAAFLARRVQETGVPWRPADSREAVARTVADLLDPEVEFAVVSAWEAYAIGEHEAARARAQGDPLIFVHMLAAFSAAIGHGCLRPRGAAAHIARGDGIAGAALSMPPGQTVSTAVRSRKSAGQGMIQAHPAWASRMCRGRRGTSPRSSLRRRRLVAASALARKIPVAAQHRAVSCGGHGRRTTVPVLLSEVPA